MAVTRAPGRFPPIFECFVKDNGVKRILLLKNRFQLPPKRRNRLFSARKSTRREPGGSIASNRDSQTPGIAIRKSRELTDLPKCRKSPAHSARIQIAHHIRASRLGGWTARQLNFRPETRRFLRFGGSSKRFFVNKCSFQVIMFPKMPEIQRKSACSSRCRSDRDRDRDRDRNQPPPTK